MSFGVYVHIPWCRVQCPYCAFNVSTRPAPPHALYTDALIREMELRRLQFVGGRDGRPISIYFGGGTPSLCPPEEIARIVAALSPAPNAEISLEANPGHLPFPLAAFRDAGVTRLSLGVQSFDPWVARRLGRGHTSDDARALVLSAKHTGFTSVSFDLIFAVPGQTLARFQEDLNAVRELEPDHVSLYGLTIEPDTPFARRKSAPVSEDLWRSQYDAAVDALGEMGLARYEVSNFARPEHRSRHNEHYWRARPWAGLGAGAHAWWPDGTRGVNIASPDAYMGAADPLEQAERPEAVALGFELLWSTLRHVEGVDRALLRRHTGLALPLASEFVGRGLVTDDGDKIVLTNAGFPLADGIAARLAATLQPGPPPSPEDRNEAYSSRPVAGET